MKKDHKKPDVVTIEDETIKIFLFCVSNTILCGRMTKRYEIVHRISRQRYAEQGREAPVERRNGCIVIYEIEWSHSVENRFLVNQQAIAISKISASGKR